MKSPAQRAVLVIAGAAIAVVAWRAASAQVPGQQTVQTTVGEQVATDKAAAASQSRINNLDDEAQRMFNEYRATAREAESLRRYNEQLALQIKSQQEEMVSIQEQITQIERTNREIYPLMQRMVETLESFVALDLPFLAEERSKRIAGLKEMMPRADVSTAEKYRRILESYQVEMEYGRSLEAYEGKLGEGEEPKTVNFLRVGRVALLYQTLDGDESGYWDAQKKEWVEDNGYQEGIADGLKVARKLVAPDLLKVPVPAPTESAAQEAPAQKEAP